jgi:outer membrane lipopolysaccharide assembly protein LptE/RlpB
VSSNIDSLVARALKKKIERKRSGALATDPLAADITISITEENSQKVLAVLSNTGSVDEYEITYNVTFDISSKNGRIEAPVQDRLTLKRQMTYEDQALTAKSDEERTLIEDMASEVATRILVRLSRVTQTQ